MTRGDPSLTGRCLGCDYLLRDLPSPRCPECGRPFDPLDASTMRMGPEADELRRWLTDLRRWFTQRLAWPGVVVALLPMLLLVWVFSSPRLYYMGIILVLLAVALMLPLIAMWPSPRGAGKVRRGTLLGMIVVTCASIWFFELPMRIRFALSLPAMNRLLRDVRADPTAPQPKRQWIGLFEVGEIRPPRLTGGITRFYEPGSLEVGFAYSDTPIRGYPGINAGAGGHLFGGWYWFSDD